jgi:hypothetical protein
MTSRIDSIVVCEGFQGAAGCFAKRSLRWAEANASPSPGGASRIHEARVAHIRNCQRGPSSRSRGWRYQLRASRKEDGATADHSPSRERRDDA